MRTRPCCRSKCSSFMVKESVFLFVVLKKKKIKLDKLASNHNTQTLVVSSPLLSASSRLLSLLSYNTLNSPRRLCIWPVLLWEIGAGGNVKTSWLSSLLPPTLPLPWSRGVCRLPDELLERGYLSVIVSLVKLNVASASVSACYPGTLLSNYR